MDNPATNRTVAPTSQHPGMTQIEKAGRCFQINATGPDATALLKRHAQAVLNGTPLPDYGRRWPEIEP